MSAAFVVAVVATFHRALELARLLDSLEKIPRDLGAVIVVDNGAENSIEQIVRNAECETRYIPASTNLGCGGGLRLAETTALQLYGDRLTHLWILDDDTIVPPDILDVLLAEMECARADAACPLVLDGNGKLGWFPGLLDTEKFRAIRSARARNDFVEIAGEKPIAFSWAQGISLLVARRAIDELGFHRDDYWVRGEDLEFSLRITARYRGIFVPRVAVQHIPPVAKGVTNDLEQLRHAAMLQNIVYTSFYLPHGRRILRTIPGNFLRFLRAWGLRAIADSVRALWLGGIRGEPAGKKGAERFLDKFRAIERSTPASLRSAGTRRAGD